ncbi:MAG: hypothetical protein HY925_06615 [Elusimicrobia bacterium]|nr:hypothetical protein [Elusimicrobiota bacterium]
MNTMKLAVAALALAKPASAAPPARLASSLQTSIADASRRVLKGIRNEAYSLELVRLQAQANVASARAFVSRKQLSDSIGGLRERVLEETAEFLKDFGSEVDRLAAESRTGVELADRLERLAAPSRVKADAPSALLEPTLENIEGPFYRPDAPWGTNLAPAGAAGTPAVISGRVLGTDGRPLANAIVDVWQADSAGAYDIDHPRDRTNPSIPYKFRVRMKTDSSGRYAYRTILPGEYEIGEGKWRPKHIHYKVSADGFRPLTTQLYFEGDPYNAVDAWWRQATTIPLNGNAGTFDVILARR